MTGGGLAGTSVRFPESQDEACEFLKGPIVLVIDVLFSCFHFFFEFPLFSVYFEKMMTSNLQF